MLAALDHSFRVAFLLEGKDVLYRTTNCRKSGNRLRISHAFNPNETSEDGGSGWRVTVKQRAVRLLLKTTGTSFGRISKVLGRTDSGRY